MIVEVVGAVDDPGAHFGDAGLPGGEIEFAGGDLIGAETGGGEVHEFLEGGVGGGGAAGSLPNVLKGLFEVGVLKEAGIPVSVGGPEGGVVGSTFPGVGAVEIPDGAHFDFGCGACLIDEG